MGPKTATCRTTIENPYDPSVQQRERVLKNAIENDREIVDLTTPEEISEAIKMGNQKIRQAQTSTDKHRGLERHIRTKIQEGRHP